MTAPSEADRPRRAPYPLIVFLAASVVVVALVAANADQAGEPPPARGRDLSKVTDREMENVLAANPRIVAMRLALVERYLRGGEVEKARDHARTALRQEPEPRERQRALKYLGWTTALLGDPAEGVPMLEESLALDPEDLDSMWFLANARLVGLKDREGAITLLERILRSPIPEDRREAVEKKLAAARG